MGEGLRERKKRQTRQRIAEVAVGLFVERGFDRVTIAEVAAAAEVSVNTLYNYYESKEDLVLPPDQASPQRLADIVRARPAGESAARAVLAHLRDELRRHDRAVGLTAGFGRFFEMMRAAPTLTARLEDLGRQMTDALHVVLAEETGAAADDLTPRVVASQIGWFHSLVYAEIGRRIVAGEDPDTIAKAVLELLDLVEGTLSETALDYATRSPDGSSGSATA
ncbi:TetR/AcrR family transcriptional regulator [Streptomyces sp. NPDC057743]|uniref:TetR/AcrR family transcriptional regulator n=1 Tax=Streptomyces sp. NPDC057743 TaxID=3346236 RepID=UPI0036AABFED